MDVWITGSRPRSLKEERALIASNNSWLGGWVWKKRHANDVLQQLHILVQRLPKGMAFESERPRLNESQRAEFAVVCSGHMCGRAYVWCCAAEADVAMLW